MKIDYVSDLHINHRERFNPNQLKWETRTKDWIRWLLRNKQGEVLILAGDFSEWNVQTVWALEIASELYEQVYWTIGNHDYYLLSRNQKKKYGNSKGRVQELKEKTNHLKNVVLLDGKIDTYKNKVFAGHPLWYELKTHKDIEWYTTHSNDSVYIYRNNSLWKEAVEWYKSIEEETIDVFVSHIPPVHPPISPYEYNACYVAPVPFLKGKHWVCGHQHIQGSFEKAGVQFYMNAIGYPMEKNEIGVQSFQL